MQAQTVPTSGRFAVRNRLATWRRFPVKRDMAATAVKLRPAAIREADDSAHSHALLQLCAVMLATPVVILFWRIVIFRIVGLGPMPSSIQPATE